MRVKRDAPGQDALIEALIDYKSSNEADGNSPTYQELADTLGITTATAYNTVMRLVRRGIVRINSRGKIILGGKYIPPEHL